MSEFAGIVQDELRDLRGNAMVGAVVRVREAGTSTPATLYDNPVQISAATGADALVNDATTGLPAASGLLMPGVDSGANYTFFADSDEEYDLLVTWNGLTFEYRVRPKVLVSGIDSIPPGTLVQVAGDTMTGPLVLAGDADAALQAVPKQQLDVVSTTATAAAGAAADLAADLDVIDGGGAVEFEPAEDSTVLTRWQDALAAGTATVAFIGDSTTECTLSSLSLGWPKKLMALLRADSQPGGVDPGFGYAKSHYMIGGALDAEVWTKVGGALVSSGPGLTGWRMTAAGSMSLTQTATRFDVLYERLVAGGVATVTIDGTPVESISTAGSSSHTEVKSYTGLSEASHTIVITWSSGSVTIQGAMVYRDDAATGLKEVMAARGGQSAATLDATQKWAKGLALFAPSLVFVAEGINDRNGDFEPVGSAFPAYSHSMQSVIAQVRAACVIEPWIVICNQWETDNPAAYPHDDYQAVLEGMVAADTSLGYLDFRPVIGDGLVNPGNFVDGSHPTAAGFDLLAAAAYVYVTGV